ncbi:unnamed protein product [Durusdinium trenchii]|uniref:PNPLA domain-containing protein n=1 Tax=Durusdinium trenchii TaxID=1381693 RepID=A0ABP0HNB1_9DINO
MDQEEWCSQITQESISDVSTTDHGLSTTSLEEIDSSEASLPVPGDVPRPRPVLLRCLHFAIYYSCIIITALVLTFRRILAIFVDGKPATQKLSRPKAKLSWAQLAGAKDPARLAREVMPEPPPFPVPTDEFTITFGPCANLMIYTGGVACCLQRCPNFAEVKSKLRFHGVSSGAFIAATMAADVELLEMLPEMLSWTQRFRSRLWGLVGAYSASISEIVWRIFSRAECFERAKTCLSMGVTTFTPFPGRFVMDTFDSASELVTALLGSCYIPVAFEVPQWSQNHGPFWDGGIFEFASQGDLVVSPFEGVLPDVYPEVPYPKCFSFFPPHEADAVSLFEDGYMDCLRWLEQGAVARKEAREEAFGFTQADSKSQDIGPLLSEGFGTQT